jgi:uncharacterized protein YecE (DUF72 family)
VSARYRIGTSGWAYPHWRGVFYPEDLPQGEWFTHYARHFDTVEINSTFYRLPEASTFDHWRQQAPEGFLYAVKANRYITHYKHLKDCAEPVARFLERARRLEDHLGPVLYQLPPHWGANPERLEAFAALLPRDLAHVFEFRNGGWFIEPVREILERHHLGFCIFDLPNASCPLWVTGQLAYVRFHGADRAYGGRYDHDELAAWARRIPDVLGQDRGLVCVYFNNDAFGYAPENAKEFDEIVEEDGDDKL